MTGADVERVRAFMNAWSALDFRALRDTLEAGAGLAEAEGASGECGRLHAELIDPGIHFDVSAVEAYSVIWPRGTGDGIGDWLRMWENWFTSWESIAPRHSGYTEAGDSVIQEFRAHMVARGSGLELDLHHFHRWGMRDGRIVSFVVHRTLEDALAAAGLTR